VWDPAAQLQSVLDSGTSTDDTPRLEGIVTSGEWAATWSWPSGSPAAFTCTIDL